MEHNICVLIDFENIAAGCEKENLGRFNVKAVMDRLKDKGRILEARAYGDWGRFARFKQNLLEQGVNMIELTSYRGQEKNRADIALVVDAMELAFTRDYLTTFVVLSGDSDFTPLVNRLRAMNKRVIGLGTRGSTSRLIISAVDEFIFYDSLRKEVRKRPEPAEAETEAALSVSKADAFTLLVETLAGLQKDDPQPVLAGLVKQSMQRKVQTFDEGDYGYSNFARFLEAGQAKDLVALARAERAGGYQVDQPGATNGEPVAEEESDDLPTLEGNPLRWRDTLHRLGTNPLSHMIRHTVVHEFVDHVQDRAAKKRKNSLKYTIGDTARRCRKTDPPIPTRHVRAVVNALAQAGLLLHPDGTPVRSPSAPFEIRNDPEELLSSLLVYYIKTLSAEGEDLSNTTELSHLLYGDDAHAEAIQEVVGGIESAAPPPAEAEATAPVN